MRSLIAAAFFLCAPAFAADPASRPAATYKGKAADYWIKAIADRDLETRKEAAGALRAIGAETGTVDPVAALKVAIKDKNEFVRVDAAVALAEYHGFDPDAFRVLAAELQGEDHQYEFMADATEGLAAMGPGAKDALPRLREWQSKGEAQKWPLDGHAGHFLKAIRTAIRSIDQRQQ